jgi:hypothetical protein
MKKITDLKEMLSSIEPRLTDGQFFMASIESSKIEAITDHMEYVLCIYRENEGMTLVFSEEVKKEIEGLTGESVAGPFSLITLDVFSDLMSIGFLARITDALAKEKISVNTFSAYHHDHLLVPYEKREEAMKVLKELQGKKKD